MRKKLNFIIATAVCSFVGAPLSQQEVDGHMAQAALKQTCQDLSQLATECVVNIVQRFV